MNAAEAVGAEVGITFYAPGMEGEEALKRVHKALRSEFGTDVLQIRTQHHRAVCETWLP